MTSHRPTDHSLELIPGGHERWLPAWLLRPRLRARLLGTELQIDRIERALAQEFGLQETAPLHQELEALRSLRDALHERLSRLG